MELRDEKKVDHVEFPRYVRKPVSIHRCICIFPDINNNDNDNDNNNNDNDDNNNNDNKKKDSNKSITNGLCCSN